MKIRKRKWVNDKSKVKSFESEVYTPPSQILGSLYIYISISLVAAILLLEVERKFIDFRLCLLKGELPRSVKSFTRKETPELGLRFAKYKYNVKLANCIATQ